jgi:hypothetical protein
MNQTQGEFYVALTELRTSIEAKIDKVDERQRHDIAKLEEKNDKWQDEVRDEFTDVKNRLTTIETKVATKEQIGDQMWIRYSGVIALLLSFGLLVVMIIKPPHNTVEQRQTITQTK